MRTPPASIVQAPDAKRTSAACTIEQACPRRAALCAICPERTARGVHDRVKLAPAALRCGDMPGAHSARRARSSKLAPAALRCARNARSAQRAACTIEQACPRRAALCAILKLIPEILIVNL